MREIQFFIPDRQDFIELFDEMKNQITEIHKKLESVKYESSSSEVKYLTRQETCLKFRISLPTLDKHIRAGLPSKKVGSKRLFNPNEVEKYFATKVKK
ncbi:MAG: helix-turn-helix domain-containing protein [Sediminibacterium sp.]|jgi:hypothetical protein|nr:helix-turn-helix domain-containing protein [Sediminibacterium sp.]